MEDRVASLLDVIRQRLELLELRLGVPVHGRNVPTRSSARS
jgi:hypothetical protein